MPLVIYLKMMELQQIMRVINNQSYIRQCDFNRDLHNQNDILASLAQCGFPDIADQMKNMQQAMNMMQVQAEPDNTSISTDTEYTNNNPSIQGNRTDEKIHDSSTHENTKNTSTTDQSLSQHSDNSIDHIMQLLQEYDTNTRSAT